MIPIKSLFLILGFCIGLSVTAHGQITFCQQPVSRGSLQVKADSSFHEVIDSTLHTNRQSRKIEGYRIQIYFGGNRKRARRVKARFLRQYPDKQAYTLYQRPNFKIRVGNFRNKLEAQKLYHALNKDFNTVFIVPTRIEYPPLPQVN